jgi:two-component system chemotaxis response regulator CheY
MASKKVLIIDDSPTVRQDVAKTLGGAGFEVLEAVDGEDGLDVLARTSDAALVICDINMPSINGLEFLETVKKDPKHAALPILMLTTEGQPNLVERAKKAGAKGWIVKPFKPDLLIATAKKLT